jgi:hypothetical protein
VETGLKGNEMKNAALSVAALVAASKSQKRLSNGVEEMAGALLAAYGPSKAKVEAAYYSEGFEHGFWVEVEKLVNAAS